MAAHQDPFRLETREERDARFRQFVADYENESEKSEEPELSLTQLPLPDLRFEYSYLRSISKFFSIRRTPVQPPTQVPAEVERVREEIVLQWRSILWTTTRDQVLSPFLQGALWALASCYLSPISSQFGAKVGTYVRKITTRDGTGVAFLKQWAAAFGVSSNRHV